MNSAAKKHSKGSSGPNGPKGSKDSKSHNKNDRNNQKGGSKSQPQKGGNTHKQKDMKTVKKNGQEKKKENSMHGGSKKRLQCIKILNIFIDLLCAITDLFICNCCIRKKSVAKIETKVKEKPISKQPVTFMSMVQRNPTPIVHDDEYYLNLYKTNMYAKQITSPEEAIALRPIRINPIHSRHMPVTRPLDLAPIPVQTEEEEEDEEESDIEQEEQEDEYEEEEEEEDEDDQDEDQEFEDSDDEEEDDE